VVQHTTVNERRDRCCSGLKTAEVFGRARLWFAILTSPHDEIAYMANRPDNDC